MQRTTTPTDLQKHGRESTHDTVREQCKRLAGYVFFFTKPELYHDRQLKITKTLWNDFIEITHNIHNILTICFRWVARMLLTCQRVEYNASFATRSLIWILLTEYGFSSVQRVYGTLYSVLNWGWGGAFSLVWFRALEHTTRVRISMCGPRVNGAQWAYCARCALSFTDKTRFKRGVPAKS